MLFHTGGESERESGRESVREKEWQRLCENEIEIDEGCDRPRNNLSHNASRRAMGPQQHGSVCVWCHPRRTSLSKPPGDQKQADFCLREHGKSFDFIRSILGPLKRGREFRESNCARAELQIPDGSVLSRVLPSAPQPKTSRTTATTASMGL